MSKKNILLCFLVTLTTALVFNSCASSSSNINVTNNVATRDILPRKAFIYVQKTMSIYKCLDGRCMNMNFNSSGSAFVVKITNDGSYIVTAAHVCENNVPQGMTADRVSAEFKVQRLDGGEFKAAVLTYNRENEAAPEISYIALGMNHSILSKAVVLGQKLDLSWDCEQYKLMRNNLEMSVRYLPSTYRFLLEDIYKT